MIGDDHVCCIFACTCAWVQYDIRYDMTWCEIIFDIKTHYHKPDLYKTYENQNVVIAVLLDTFASDLHQQEFYRCSQTRKETSHTALAGQTKLAAPSASNLGKRLYHVHHDETIPITVWIITVENLLTEIDSSITLSLIDSYNFQTFTVVKF